MPHAPLSPDELADLVERSKTWLDDLHSRADSGRALVDDTGAERSSVELWRALFRRGRDLADHGQTALARDLYQFAETHCAEDLTEDTADS